MPYLLKLYYFSAKKAKRGRYRLFSLFIIDFLSHKNYGVAIAIKN
jgi:hypothetical protein